MLQKRSNSTNASSRLICTRTAPHTAEAWRWPRFLEMVHCSGFGGTGQGGSLALSERSRALCRIPFYRGGQGRYGNIFGDMFGGMFPRQEFGGSSRSRHFPRVGFRVWQLWDSLYRWPSFGGFLALILARSGFGGFGGSQGFHSADFREKGF